MDEMGVLFPIGPIELFAFLDLNRATVMSMKAAFLWAVQTAEVLIVPGCSNAILRGHQQTLVGCFSLAFYADLFFLFCGFLVEILRIPIDSPTIELLRPTAVLCLDCHQHSP